MPSPSCRSTISFSICLSSHILADTLEAERTKGEFDLDLSLLAGLSSDCAQCGLKDVGRPCWRSSALCVALCHAQHCGFSFSPVRWYCLIAKHEFTPDEGSATLEGSLVAWRVQPERFAQGFRSISTIRLWAAPDEWF